MTYLSTKPTDCENSYPGPRCGMCPGCDLAAAPPEVSRLAYTLAQAMSGPPTNEIHPEWYVEDAEVIAMLVPEGDSWIVEPGSEGALADEHGFFKVNGVELWFDWNGEGMTTPVLGADRRAELAAEAEDA